MLLIPVKNLESAKQRLSPVLDSTERRALAEAMIEDVFEAVGAWRKRPQVLIVSSDDFANTLARRYDFEVLKDEKNGGETNAVQIATHACVQRGARFSLVIPGDVPLVTAAELQQIMDSAPSHGSLLVPAWDGRGTNAAFRAPADLFPLRFGNDSFQPHLRAAQATGESCVTVRLPGLAIDVDNPPDLNQLVAAPGNTRAQKLARKWQLAGRAVCS